MPQIFVVKLIHEPYQHPGLIHKISMPVFGERGFYRDISKWNGFAHGQRKSKISKEDKQARRTGCCWSPQGLYYCHDLQEKQWISKCQNAREHQVEMGHPERQDEVDERLWPTIEHQCLDDFLIHIGFDRKTRKFI